MKAESVVEEQAAAVATDALIDLASATARKAALDILRGVVSIFLNIKAFCKWSEGVVAHEHHSSNFWVIRSR
jgi:hypothetical protein